jgi:cytochrome b561
MKIKSRYTSVAIGLHWAMALLIVGLFGIGFYMADLPLSPWKLKLYSWHKWAGVTAFLLVALRLAWRIGHRPPDLPATMSPAMRLLAHGGHAVLYLLMLAVPLSGWLMSSAKGFQTVYFGLLPIPDLLAKNKELGDLLADLHSGLNVLFVAVVIGHLAAALKHHFIDRDDILSRMLPSRSTTTQE